MDGSSATSRPRGPADAYPFPARRAPGRCLQQAGAQPVYQALPVERRDIVVSAQASGAIQPDTMVEVKSKASGEILQILVETGQLVKRGTLLVRIDPRQAKNAVDQAKAQLTWRRRSWPTPRRSSTARRAVQGASRSRSRSTRPRSSTTPTRGPRWCARASTSRTTRSARGHRRQRADHRHHHPEGRGARPGDLVGDHNVGGGTVLLKMADLNLVQVRTLVDETDIGKIQAGQPATVTVDAYPNRPFQGEVLKIEPQAEVQQNVTMFPVLVRIDNREGLLRPGMNAEVEIHVGQRDSVLAVPERGAPHPEGRGVGGRRARPQHGSGATPSSPRPTSRHRRATRPRRARSRSAPARAPPRHRRGKPRRTSRRQHHDHARRAGGEAARWRHREAGARASSPSSGAASSRRPRSARCCRRCGSSTAAGRAVAGSGPRATTTSSAAATSCSCNGRRPARHAGAHRPHRPRLQRSRVRPQGRRFGAGAAEREPGQFAAGIQEPDPDHDRRRRARHAPDDTPSAGGAARPAAPAGR